MKRMIALLLTLVLSLSLTACGDSRPDPEDAVKHALDSVKTADADGLHDSFNGELDGLMDMMGEEDRELLRLLTENITYTIDKVAEAPDGSTVVTVTVTGPDARILVPNFVKEFMAYTFQFAFQPADQMPTEEEVMAAVTEIVREVMASPDNKMVTTTVDVEVTWEGEDWKIQNEYELVNGLLGGLLDRIGELMAAFEDIGA